MAAFYETFATPGAGSRECAPAACPECGGLECLCRPRFFAGQLLTDEDLNLLDRYVVEKNKLHNRHLVGWGVVCGLEVVCNPCNMVTVRPGYALSPCGEDIVVCREAVVDVCALVNKCREAERRRRECEPYNVGVGNEDCKNLDEEWVLTVRYEEKPSRAITPLKGGTTSSSCGCGSGSGGCGCRGGGSQGCGCGSGGGGKSGGVKCGCKSSHAGARATSQGAKGVPAQCEPTVTCEGYVFELCKVTSKMRNDEKQPNLGALAERAQRCFKDFMDALPKEPPPQSNPSLWRQYCCDLKEALLDFLASHPVYDCGLAEKIARFTCPELTQNNASTYASIVSQEIKNHLSPVAAEYIRYCICSVLLPPCPAPVEDARVPLASIIIRRDNCRVVRVCNLSYRKFVTTFPNLQYWFSFVPFVRQLRTILERLCCREFELRVPQQEPTTVVGVPQDAAAAPFAAESMKAEEVKGGSNISSLADTDFAKMFASAWGRKNEDVDARTMFMAAVGSTDEQGQPYMSEAEMKNPFLFLALNQMARPVMARVPDETPSVLKGAARAGAEASSGGGNYATARAQPSGGGDLEELRAQLAELQETVRRQQERIDELGGNRGDVA